MDVRRLSPSIGAVITGVDCSQPLTSIEVADLRAAWLEHLVVFILGQDLTTEEHTAFAAQFGDLTVGHPVEPPLAADRRVHSIDSAYGRTDFWHTDVTFMEQPPTGAVLRPIELPRCGGDTMWSSTRSAYDDLPAALQRACEDLSAVHFDSGYAARVAAGEGNDWDGSQVTEMTPVQHPVVRVHDETGRRSLFVNPGFTTRLAGFDPVTSRGLLRALYEHMTQPKYIIRHRWEPGTLAFWDNRATMHFGVNDYGDARRVMHRVSLQGTRPAGPTLGGPP